MGARQGCLAFIQHVLSVPWTYAWHLSFHASAFERLTRGNVYERQPLAVDVITGRSRVLAARMIPSLKWSALESPTR